MQALTNAFFNDQRVQIALLLVALDLVLGVVVGVVKGEFRLSFIADFLRADVLGKVVPFFALYAGYKYASGADLVIPGLDMEVVMDGAWVLVLAALLGSLFNSLRDLGIWKDAPEPIAGPDPTTPM